MQMIRVQTASRVHFGLCRVTAPADLDGSPGRNFGGVGMMVEAPGLKLAVRPAQGWFAEGPLAERALAFARQFAATFPPDTFAPFHFIIEHAAPEHAGLGTGTQLALAVARALLISCRRTYATVAELAHRVGRGVRSTVGVYGFELGGFLVDAGKPAYEDMAQLPARLAFPEEWPLVLVTPQRHSGLHGAAERKAFQDLIAPTAGQSDELWRLLRLDLLPALAARDFETFSEALHEFNTRVGETFATVQGGTYATPEGAELVAFLRRRGIRGVGQSSWGPTIFALLEDERNAHDLVDVLLRQLALEEREVVLTRACNHGASVIV